MEDFRKFELEITKDKLALLEIAELYRELLANNRQVEAFGLLEKSQYYKLTNDFKQKVFEFQWKVLTTPIIGNNVRFIKKSNQFLAQFYIPDETANEVFIEEIDSLIKEKNTALKEKEFRKANVIREKIVGIQKKVFNREFNIGFLSMIKIIKTEEFNQLITNQIEKLTEARQTALSNKDFKLAEQLLEKSVALKQKLE